MGLLPHTRVWLKAPDESPRPFLLAEVVSATDAVVQARLLPDGPAVRGSKETLCVERDDIFLAEPLGPNGSEATEEDNCSLTHLSDARSARDYTLVGVSHHF